MLGRDMLGKDMLSRMFRAMIQTTPSAVILGMACGIFALGLGGCASFSIAPAKSPSDTTQGEVAYKKGVQILRSALPHSKVQVELAQQSIANDTIVLYISAQLAGDLPQGELDKLAPFSTTHVRASFGELPLQVLSYEKLRKSDYDFIDILQDFNIPTPTPSSNPQTTFYNISPFYYMMDPAFLFYMPMASPFVIENASSVAYAQEKRGALKVLLMNYLRESSLSTKEAQGGFVAIRRAGIRESGILHLEVHIGQDVHSFSFAITKT